MDFIMKATITIFCIAAVIAANVLAADILTLPSTTRQPSLQAYGLPKHYLLNNGEIERIHLRGRFSVASGPLEKSLPWGSQPPRNQKNEKDSGKIGVIERELVPPKSHSISKRFSENEEIEDMETQESIVFRPLFVHRQQMEERRRRAERSRNPMISHDKNCNQKRKGQKDNRGNALH